MKTCTKCSLTKHFSEFHKDSYKKDGFSSKCKECAHIDRVKRYACTKEQSIIYSKEWAIKNPESIKKWQKKSFLKNKDAINERRRINYSLNNSIKEKNLLWQKINKPICRAKLAKYRASKKNATPKWANLTKIKEFYETADSLSMITGEWYEVDHIIPLQSNIVCGLHTESNLQILTQKENRIKSNKYWENMP